MYIRQSTSEGVRADPEKEGNQGGTRAEGTIPGRRLAAGRRVWSPRSNRNSPRPGGVDGQGWQSSVASWPRLGHPALAVPRTLQLAWRQPKHSSRTAAPRQHSPEMTKTVECGTRGQSKADRLSGCRSRGLGVGQRRHPFFQPRPCCEHCAGVSNSTVVRIRTREESARSRGFEVARPQHP